MTPGFAASGGAIIRRKTVTVTVGPRKDVPVVDTWDLENIYPTVTAWEEAASSLIGRLEGLAGFEGRLGEGPETLLRWLASMEDVLRDAARVMAYASLDYSVEMTNQPAAARQDRARGLNARVQAAIAFAEPEILTLGEERLKAWMAEEPRLASYAHYFDSVLRRRAHVRSPEVEALLKQLFDPFSTAASTHRILADADLPFVPASGSEPEAELIDIAQSNIGALLTHADREVRRSAWENYADAYLAFKNTMANALATGVKQDVFFARARNYRSSLEAALYPNNIPTEVFHTTIDTFRRHLPLWHRYWRLRRQALGYDRLHVYDIKAPLTAASPEVTFDQAAEWISAGMAPLGDEYVAVMRRGMLEERWVDKYPNIAKRSGAFSYGVPGTHPFIMMSYTDDLFSLSTLAHELGHSMHSYLSWKHQPLIYARYTLFAAEVASNFNQALVRAHLLESQDNPQFQIALLEEAMSNFHRYFFIMPTLARFELEIHERVERGEALSADTLIGLMADLFAEGYGGEVEFDRERIGITWAQFPTHLYSNFYVFQYTTGIGAAHALAQRVLDGDEEATANYLAFLQAGGSLYPLEALQMAGVDMNSAGPVEAAFAVLGSYVDRLEELTAG
jgi:oligoendopeptidase F